MATDKQLSNPYLMEQKVSKAVRLLREVELAIDKRPSKDHHMWRGIAIGLDDMITLSGQVLTGLDYIRVYNQERDKEKI